MGWIMLFWVVVIVGVPTVLWFLLSEPRLPSRMPDDNRNGNPLDRSSRSGADHKEEDANDVILSG
jgi:predicted MFS family arabinose efflux permease